MDSYKGLVFFINLLSILLLNGCAYTDAKVALTYEPVVSVTTRYADRVVVQKFEDTRSNKKVIGFYFQLC